MRELVDDSRLMAEQPEISSTEPDWSREAIAAGEYSPSKRLLAAIRRYQRASGNSLIRRLIRARSVLAHRFWSAVCSCDIPLNGKIGGGLLLPHPYAIVIHPECEIGPNCLIFQGVTIGAATGTATGDLRVPRIGGHVDIGAGAKILGGVTVGDHARIGANAVVLSDVPPNSSAVGVPARVITHGEAAEADE